MKTAFRIAFLLALTVLVRGESRQYDDEHLAKHTALLCDAFSAYLAAVQKTSGPVDSTKQAVVHALTNWKVTHQRLLKELIAENTTGLSEKNFRIRTATALCMATEGFREKDFEPFTTDSSIITDYLFVRELIDYGNSLTYGTLAR